MSSDPGKELFIIHFAGGYAKTGGYNVLVGTVQANSVDFQKGQHDIHADALIPIYKGAIRDERKAQSCPLFFLGGIELLPIEGLKNAFQCAIQ